MPRVLISGGTGLIGSALTAALRADGVIVNHLVRRKEATSPNEVAWTPTSAIVDTAAMEGYDAVVHLGGANLAQGRWTKSRKQILRNSRVDTTRVLVDALARLQKKPSVFICASGVGYYGSRGDEILTEGSGNGSDFLGMTCRAWEAEATRANSNGIRRSSPVSVSSSPPTGVHSPPWSPHSSSASAPASAPANNGCPGSRSQMSLRSCAAQ